MSLRNQMINANMGVYENLDINDTLNVDGQIILNGQVLTPSGGSGTNISNTDGTITVSTVSGGFVLSNAGANPVNNINMNNLNITNINGLNFDNGLSIYNNSINNMSISKVVGGNIVSTGNIYDSNFNKPTVGAILGFSNNALGNSITNLNKIQLSNTTVGGGTAGKITVSDGTNTGTVYDTYFNPPSGSGGSNFSTLNCSGQLLLGNQYTDFDSGLMLAYGDGTVNGDQFILYADQGTFTIRQNIMSSSTQNDSFMLNSDGSVQLATNGVVKVLQHNGTTNPTGRVYDNTIYTPFSTIAFTSSTPMTVSGSQGNGTQVPWQAVDSANTFGSSPISLGSPSGDQQLNISGFQNNSTNSVVVRVSGFVCWSNFVSPTSSRVVYITKNGINTDRYGYSDVAVSQDVPVSHFSADLVLAPSNTFQLYVWHNDGSVTSIFEQYGARILVTTLNIA